MTGRYAAWGQHGGARENRRLRLLSRAGAASHTKDQRRSIFWSNAQKYIMEGTPLFQLFAEEHRYSYLQSQALPVVLVRMPFLINPQEIHPIIHKTVILSAECALPVTSNYCLSCYVSWHWYINGQTFFSIFNGTFLSLGIMLAISPYRGITCPRTKERPKMFHII